MKRQHYKGRPSREIGSCSVTEEEAALLYGLAVALRPRCIAEVGTGPGRSLRAFVEAIDYLRSELGWACELWTCDTDECMLRPVQEKYPKIHVVLGDSRDLASQVRPAPELVFIDASHDYAGVTSDFQRMVSVAAPGALLVFHDLGVLQDVRHAADDIGCFHIPTPRGIGLWRLSGGE